MPLLPNGNYCKSHMETTFHPNTYKNIILTYYKYTSGERSSVCCHFNCFYNSYSEYNKITFLG